MSSVVDWLKNIATNIVEIPSKIVNAILDLPELIFEGIKSIFIPDTEEIKIKFNNMIHNAQTSFGIVDDGFTDLQNSITEKPVENIEENYKIHGIGTLKLKFFDTKYLKDGVERFRPVIRGFVVLLLFFYNYAQLLSFIKQDARIGVNSYGAFEKSHEQKGGK